MHFMLIILIEILSSMMITVLPWMIKSLKVSDYIVSNMEQINLSSLKISLTAQTNKQTNSVALSPQANYVD
jgi:hypothetical protein